MTIDEFRLTISLGIGRCHMEFHCFEAKQFLPESCVAVHMEYTITNYFLGDDNNL